MTEFSSSSVSARRVYRRLEERDLVGLAALIARKHLTTLDDLLGRCRRREVAAARRDLVMALRELGLSTPTIGHILDRDHSTVLSHIWTACGVVSKHQRARDRREVA